MQHQRVGRKLGRTTSHRHALIRNLLISLVRYERLRTTVTRTKELRKWVDKLVRWGKQGNLHGRRLAYNLLQDRDLVNKLFTEIAPRYKDRTGGYSRIFRSADRRKGDGAELAFMEFIPEQGKERPLMTIIPHAERKRRAEMDQETLRERSEEKEQKKSLKARREDEKAKAAPDVSHGKISTGRKTEKGTGRSGVTKKGLS